MTGFLGALVVLLLVLVVILVILVAVLLHKQNTARWGYAAGNRLPALRQSRDTCCHDVPCSARCAERRQTLMISGAVDAARGGEGFRAILQAFEQSGLGNGGAGKPAA